MKYCLLCNTEYLDEIDLCADDGETLVDAATYEQLRNQPLRGPLRVLRHLEGQFHAHVVRDVLEKEGIPFTIRTNVDTAYSKIFVPAKGWGMALVLADDVERADKAVRAVMETAFETASGGATTDD